jgi:hypothetical protein
MGIARHKNREGKKGDEKSGANKQPFGRATFEHHRGNLSEHLGINAPHALDPRS